MRPSIFIKQFHRYSGLVLILLVGLKIFSGYILTQQIEMDGKVGVLLHFAKWIDIPLIILFTVHSVYGVIKFFITPQERNKPHIFWSINGVAIAIILIAFYFIYF